MAGSKLRIGGLIRCEADTVRKVVSMFQLLSGNACATQIRQCEERLLLHRQGAIQKAPDCSTPTEDNLLLPSSIPGRAQIEFSASAWQQDLPLRSWARAPAAAFSLKLPIHSSLIQIQRNTCAGTNHTRCLDLAPNHIHNVIITHRCSCP